MIGPGAQRRLTDRLAGVACVDVWLIEVSDDGPLGLRAAEALLTAPERLEIEHRYRGESRAQSIIARAALRRLVAAYAGGDPRTIALGRDHRGRPLVLGSAARISVSIAHSGAFVACAAARQEIGIDIEPYDRPEADEYLAGRVCVPAERHLLELIRPEKRREALVRLWVRKEALSKAFGQGLGLEPATVDVCKDTPVLSGEPQKGWSVRDLVAPSGYAAAVAARGRRTRVRAQLYPAPSGRFPSVKTPR